jgi:hypothetical protein
VINVNANLNFDQAKKKKINKFHDSTKELRQMGSLLDGKEQNENTLGAH